MKKILLFCITGLTACSTAPTRVCPVFPVEDTLGYHHSLVENAPEWFSIINDSVATKLCVHPDESVYIKKYLPNQNPRYFLLTK
jgi:hypothetical protein